MIKIEFSGDTAKEVMALVKTFATDPELGEVNTSKKVTKKADPEEDEEPAPKKKVTTAKSKLTEEDVRKALVGTEWEKSDMAAFTRKFGYARIPEVPSNEYQDYLDKLEEVAAMAPKKRAAWLSEEEL